MFFIHQGRIKLSKSDSKEMYNATKDFYFQEIFYIHLRILKLYQTHQDFHKNIVFQHW